MKHSASLESLRGGLWSSPHPPGICRREGWGLCWWPRSFVTFAPVPTERDVSRTDRTNKFYEGPQNPGLGLLSDILLTYCMYHFDLGGCRSARGWGRAFPPLGGRWGPRLRPDPVSPQATSRA